MIAKFEKVSFERFLQDYQNSLGGSEEEIRKIYDDLTLPARATKGSAGYDFVSPDTFVVKPGHTLMIPTGIRAKIADGYVLLLFPRSGLGFKYRMQLNNTVGVIDADYYEADNEGHIMCKITNDTNEDKELVLNKGKGMVQGIFVAFGLAEEEVVETERTGGFGSTGV